MQDVLQEAMDLEGLNEVLRGIAAGTIRCLAVDTPVPSQFAHELLNANPYAFLDDAGLEERRARAVTLRRVLPDSVADGAGQLDQAAIDTVRSELWPDLRDEHELHDLLHSLVALPLGLLDDPARETRHWPHHFELLKNTERGHAISLNGIACWTATERRAHIDALSSGFAEHATDSVTKEIAIKQCVQGWLQILGPTTAQEFADRRSFKRFLGWRCRAC
jgi:ATP-dependent Lhr-like helicase